MYWVLIHPSCTKKRAQTLAEYAVIIAVISIVVVLVLSALGTNVSNVYGELNDRLEPPGSDPQPGGELP